jgi:enediyne biosynthesis protein E4
MPRFAGAIISILFLLSPNFVQGQAVSENPPSNPNFVDITKPAGLDKVKNVFGGRAEKKYIIETTGTGVAVIDYNDDGFPDLFFPNGTTVNDPRLSAAKTKSSAPPSSTPEPTNQLMRNNGDGTFSDVTDATGLHFSGWGQGACVGDFDNDGLPDLYVTYYGKNRLYRNQKGGKFIDVTESSGAFSTRRAWSTGCAFFDYDRDGLLDILVSTYVDFDINNAPAPGEATNCQWKGVSVMCGPRGLPYAPNMLFHNLANGRFENVSKQAGIEKTNGHYCFSVSPVDFDNDGWMDVYVACDSTPSILFRNNHDGTFTDVAVIAGAAYNEDGREQAGMGATVGDYNNDGNLDIFKTNFSDDTSTLYRNNGDGSFNDVTYPAGIGINTQHLGWGAVFFDFDNDGWLDLFQVNGHVYPEVDIHKLGSEYRETKVLYRNLGNGKFADISATSGAAVQAKTSARGLAVADLDNDGSLELVITNMGESPMLLKNQAKYPNHWLGLKLVGTTANRSAIGARVEIQAGGRKFVDEVRSGSSFNSSNDLRLHFGLGPASSIESLTVRWPNGKTERFNPAAVDRIHQIVEGTGVRPAATSAPSAGSSTSDRPPSQ